MVNHIAYISQSVLVLIYNFNKKTIDNHNHSHNLLQISVCVM